MLRSSSRSIIILALLAAATLLTPAPSALAVTCGSATLQAVPVTSSSEYRVFYGVGAWTATNAWAVGRRVPSGTHQDRPLVEHLVSGTFDTEAVPTFKTDTELEDVVAVSKGEAWAVGGSRDATLKKMQTLILHRTAKGWTRVPSPNLSTGYNELWGIDATSPTNVWAVGEGNVKGTLRTLIVRLVNGTWKRVPSPTVKTGASLDAIDVRTAKDAWAVGWFTTAGGVYKTLILHWDGSSWARVPSPSPSTTDSSLYGVATVAADDVWAGGAQATGASDNALLYLHWDGSSWTEVAGPQPAGTGYSYIEDVTSDSSGAVWFVGESYISGETAVVVRRVTGTTLAFASPDGTSGAALLAAGTAPGTTANFAAGIATEAAVWRSCV